MKGQTFSISVRATATSGKSFTAGFEIGGKINANSATPEVASGDGTDCPIASLTKSDQRDFSFFSGAACPADI